MTNSVLPKVLVGTCVLMVLVQLVVTRALELSAATSGPLTLATTAAGVLVFVFDKWLWSWPPFTLILKRPDLRGTWRGEIFSDWVDPAIQKKLPPIPAFFSVSQTSTELHVRQFTAESESITTSARLQPEVDGVQVVFATYRNTPKSDIRDRSVIHAGSFQLSVGGDDDEELRGEYWTDRGTRGRLVFTRLSRHKATSLAAAAKLATGAAGQQSLAPSSASPQLASEESKRLQP